jgi:hypothetical protein
LSLSAAVAAGKKLRKSNAPSAKPDGQLNAFIFILFLGCPRFADDIGPFAGLLQAAPYWLQGQTQLKPGVSH